MDAAAPLRLELAVRGSLRPQVAGDGSNVAFLDEAGAAALTYGGLQAWDAAGTSVPVRFAQATPAGSPLCVVVDDTAAIYPLTIDPVAQQTYLKASNAAASNGFGRCVAVSGDTVVVGATGEASNATGVNGNQADISASRSGAVYVFVRSRNMWTQQAYLKASNTGASDSFGTSVAVSGDIVVVGASGEASNATGVNGDQTNNLAASAGAAYVFVRNGSTWSQQAYLKASNTSANYFFGRSVAVSGNTVVVGSYGEGSNATGVNGVQTNNLTLSSGAAYVFVCSGSTWSQQAYLKASNAEAGDNFGQAVAVSGDTVVVGANFESSNATGVNGDQTNNNAYKSGAAYVFVRSGSNWSQQAYLKASNTGGGVSPAPGDNFGYAVAVSGNTVVIGAYAEDSYATGVNGYQNNDLFVDSGAAYVFVRSGSSWSQQAYLKASNTELGDNFGLTVAVSGDTVVVGARNDDSAATGINGNEQDNSAANAGAAYVFVRSGTSWSEQAYLKASNTGAGDTFGWSVAVSGETVVIGSPSESSAATGVNGDQNNNAAAGAGAAYVYLAAFATPTTATQYIARGRTWLGQGTDMLLRQAAADFTSALALEPTNEEAHFLRALTNLLLLENEPAFNNVLYDLGAEETGTLRNGGSINFPEDFFGAPIFAPAANTSSVIDWITGQLLPRLATMRTDLAAVTTDDFRTALSAAETSGSDALVDKGDVLVISAVTRGLEMVFNLLFTYNLSVPFDAMLTLDNSGQLDAQHVLMSFSSLLKFSASDRRPQFAAALLAMQQDYAAASDFISTKRGDPTKLLSADLSNNPAQDTQIRDTLASATASLNGVVTYQGTRVNLSRLMASNKSLRDWLPGFRGGEVVPDTLPDATFDGILPDLTNAQLNNRIYQLGAMWGMSQYAAEFGNLLKMAGKDDNPMADPNGDGRSNFVDWLARRNPQAADTVWQDFTHNVLPTGKNEVRLTFARRNDLADWRLLVSVSDDLITWDATETQIEIVGVPVANGDGFTETVTYRLNDAAAFAKRKFMRVEVAPK